MSASSSAPVESMTRSSSGRPGSSMEREPAAITQWSELDLGAVDVDRAVGREPGGAAHDLDLALLGEPVEPAGQLADHLVLPAAQRVEVDLGRPRT